MAEPARRPPCPICGKPSTPRERPFCGARCAEVDLGRWFAEAYRLPGPMPSPDGDDPA